MALAARARNQGQGLSGHKASRTSLATAGPPTLAGVDRAALLRRPGLTMPWQAQVGMKVAGWSPPFSAAE